jgi:acid phosphatase class B
MKKSIMMLMAISLAFALAAPAMAETAVEFSGRYFVRGTISTTPISAMMTDRLAPARPWKTIATTGMTRNCA